MGPRDRNICWCVSANAPLRTYSGYSAETRLCSGNCDCLISIGQALVRLLRPWFHINKNQQQWTLQYVLVPYVQHRTKKLNQLVYLAAYLLERGFKSTRRVILSGFFLISSVSYFLCDFSSRISAHSSIVKTKMMNNRKLLRDMPLLKLMRWAWTSTRWRHSLCHSNTYIFSVYSIHSVS